MSSLLVRATVQRLGICSTRHISSISLPIDSIDPTAARAPSSHKIISSSPSASHPQSPPSVKNVQIPFSREKSNELSQALASRTPSEVWNRYIDSINLLGSTTLPLEIHQEVLRKCTPSFQELRKNSAFAITHDFNSSPHQYEGRLQTVIRNIRAIGPPSMSDYHFILKQFAAVGHYAGSMQVFKEMLYMNISPRGLTYFLCLQAIAHRLTLPEPSASQRVTQARQMFRELMTDMSRRGIPFTSVTADLCIRIMKDTGDVEGFEALVKLGYGIDMSNPDHPPLEALGMKIPTLAMTDSGHMKFFPLSTHGLNTILDMYGRQHNISKLVQAFEVLTAPLSVKTNDSSALEDEDDFGVLDTDFSPPPLSSLVAPSASPNSTSFATLIRHISQAEHIPLARHYFLLAMDFEKTIDKDTRVALESKSISQVASPQVAVNGHMVTSILGVANRNQRISLIRWVQSQLSTILERKREALTFYTSFRETLISKGRYPTEISEKDEKATGDVEGEMDPSSPTTSSDEDLRYFTYTTDQAFKPLNLNLHIRILEQDISDLTEFRNYIAWLLGKNLERLKDRLGRRVWQGKTIYLASARQRTTVDRERWSKRVVYKLLSEEAKAHSRAKEMDRELDGKRGGTRIRKNWSRKDFFLSNRG